MYSLLGLLVAVVVGCVMMYYLWPTQTTPTENPAAGLPPGPLSKSPLAPIDDSRLMVCATNLSAIGKARNIFAIQHPDRAPASIRDLLDTGMVSHQTLQCPGRRQHTKCDYFLHWPSDASAPADALIACDFEGNHKGRRNVLQLSGAVKALTEADFQTVLVQPHNAPFAAALRQEEGQ